MGYSGVHIFCDVFRVNRFPNHYWFSLGVYNLHQITDM